MGFEPFGIIPPVVTPLTKDGKIYEAGLRNLINFLIEEGVHGLFPLGTTGEFYALTNEEYRTVLEITKEETKGRVPVYAGVTHITTRGIIAQAQIAEDVGVDALSALTPMFISPSQEEIYIHFKTLAASTSLPIILYNNRPKTGVHITPETATKLADINNIVGIKDSTGDFTNTEEYIRLCRGKEFHVMLGRDTLIYAGLCCGASGAVAACANVAPGITSEIYNCFKKGDLSNALENQYKLAPLRMAFDLGTFPAVIKAGLALRGIDVGECYAPVLPLKDDEMTRLRRIMEDMELI